MNITIEIPNVVFSDDAQTAIGTAAQVAAEQEQGLTEFERSIDSATVREAYGCARTDTQATYATVLHCAAKHYVRLTGATLTRGLYTQDEARTIVSALSALHAPYAISIHGVAATKAERATAEMSARNYLIHATTEKNRIACRLLVNPVDGKNDITASDILAMKTGRAAKMEGAELTRFILANRENIGAVPAVTKKQSGALDGTALLASAGKKEISRAVTAATLTTRDDEILRFVNQLNPESEQAFWGALAAWRDGSPYLLCDIAPDVKAAADPLPTLEEALF